MKNSIKTLIFYILSGLLVAGSIYGVFIYLPSKTSQKTQLATITEPIRQEADLSQLECPPCECPDCKCPSCECEPEIIIKEVPKEVIKEVPVEKIVYKEICSCPQTQPSPTDEFEIAKSKVEQNEIFPLITGYKDSRGSCRCSSGYNKISCNGCPYFAENKLRVGETIRMEVSAIPSKDSSVIEYKFEANVGEKPIKDWSNENFAEYTVPDIAYSSVVFTVVIRNDYPRRRTGSGYDDYIQIYYEVQP